MKHFPELNWALRFTHDKNKAVILPYKDYLDYIKDNEEDIELLDDIKVVVEEPSLIRGFKYVAMDIDDDKCLYLLYKMRKALLKIKEHRNLVIKSNLSEETDKLDKLITLAWEKRGIYPSLEKVLNYFLKCDCRKLASAIQDFATPKNDIIGIFEQIKNYEIPDELDEYEDELYRLFEKRRFQKNWKNYLKLSLFNLTNYQIENIIENYEDTIIKGLFENPYLFFENYKYKDDDKNLDEPDLFDEPIDVYKIDVGMIPDINYVKRHRKIQNLAEDSPERIRSIIIEYLWRQQDQGHCYENLENLVKQIRMHPLIYNTDADIDENGILNLDDDYKSHFIERLDIVRNNDERYVYLKEIRRAEEKIKNVITSLLSRVDHDNINIDFGNSIANAVNKLKPKIQDFDEKVFTSERTKLYDNIFKKSVYLLTGKPGSGKTFEASLVINQLKSIEKEVEVLAPTGKAALRISENIKNNTTLDLKAKTIDRFIFEKGFGWAYDDWDKLHKLPDNEKVTVVNLVIDESSMIDLQKLYILFSIIRFDKDNPRRVIFVGDENQLPPIGFGKPFQDIIAYVMSNDTLFEGHYSHLTSNCRQENDLEILRLAEAFSDKTRYYEEALDLLEKEGKVSDGLYVYRWFSEEKLQEMLNKNLTEVLRAGLEKELETCNDSRKDSIETALDSDDKFLQFNLLLGLYDNGCVPGNNAKNLALDKFQFLTPYRSGYYGTLGINTFIQSNFKDVEKLKNKWMGLDFPFFHSEKLIRTSNFYIGRGKNRKLILSNGSVGVVVSNRDGVYYYFPDSEAQRLATRSDNANRSIYVSDKENFDSAYAITVHKSQGSDFDCVFLVIPSKKALLTKELIYTALTRSKSKLFLFIYGSAENDILCKSRNISALLSRNTSIFELPEDKKKKYYPERGEEAVRSKGEYIIYKALRKSGLEFRYEEPLKLENRTYIIKPDFTIFLPEGKKIFWEHLGMLDTRKYTHDWKRRIDDYKEHGHFDKVVTTDDLEGIKDEKVQEIINDIRNNMIKETPEIRFSDHHYKLY